MVFMRAVNDASASELLTSFNHIRSLRMTTHSTLGDVAAAAHQSWHLHIPSE